MKEPELKPSDIGEVSEPQASQSSTSVVNNPRPWDSSQHDGSPEDGEEEEELPDFEEQGAEGRDPLSVPGCAQ
eukprot:774321-Karenia_brevis.AAC.1